MIRHLFQAVLAIGFALVVACGPFRSAAHAEVGPPPPVAGQELTIRVLTIAAGDHALLDLGDCAIWIQDERAGRGFVYDFGALKPDSLTSAITWLTGRLKNRVSRVPIDEAVLSWRSQNRTVQTQELDLAPAVRLSVRAELESATLLSASREYDYEPFWVSGATRVRDVVDRASGGRLRAATRRGSDGETLRRQTLALARNRFLVSLVLNLGQGAASDRPLGQWDRMFLPGEIQTTLRRVGRAGSWNDPPLISSEGTIFDAYRQDPAPASRPPSAIGGRRRLGVVAGLAIGTVLALSGWAARRRPRLRVVLGIMMGMIGLLLGLLGSTLVVGWLFGNPLVVRRNENILQLAPWGLMLSVLAVGVATGRPGAVRAAFWVTAAAAVLAAGGLLVKATPWFRQDNLPLIGLFLPIWMGLAVGLRALGWRNDSHVRPELAAR